MVAPTRPRNPYAGPTAGGRPGARTVSAAQIYRRTTIITFLSVLNLFFGSLMILGGLGVAFLLTASATFPADSRTLVQILGVIYAALGALTVVCGIGLWKLKSYGRTIQIVFSCIGLLGFPLGTLISALILVYFFKPGVKVLFSETPPSRLTAADIEDVARLQQSSAATVVVVCVVGFFVLVAFIGMIAAIAIPSLLRARVAANEAQAIGDLRTVISAEAAYASTNGGQYDELECLMRPAECIPGYPPDGPVFLAEEFPTVKNGYQREFVPGLPVDRSEVAFANLSPTSVESFVYIAYPVSPGVTGSRGFCADYIGRVCVTMDGSRPGVSGGQCEPCVELQ